MDNDELTRRDFVTTVAAGMIAAAGADLGAQQQVTETNVEIKTPDGTCDAAFITPATGAHPAVIIWPDAFGLRPSMRNMAKRLAGAGYSVLVPNPFYRVAKSPIWEDASKVDFATERPKITPLMQSIQADGAVEKDAPALIAWLDMQKQVDRNKKIGTQGYCMGGGLVVRTAAAVPNRVGAGASFHGRDLQWREDAGRNPVPLGFDEGKPAVGFCRYRVRRDRRPIRGALRREARPGRILAQGKPRELAPGRARPAAR